MNIKYNQLEEEIEIINESTFSESLPIYWYLRAPMSTSDDDDAGLLSFFLLFDGDFEDPFFFLPEPFFLELLFLLEEAISISSSPLSSLIDSASSST